MKRICVIGTGYVGLVTGSCLAELGNQVTCIDVDASKIRSLEGGIVPFFEPGLEELVGRNKRAGRLHFGTDAAFLDDAEVIFIAVGTPMAEDGQADLQYVQAAARTIASRAQSGDRKIVVNKSTVPVETGDLVASIICEHTPYSQGISVVSNPEFLREGSAIADFMEPDRVVLGVYDEESADIMRELYAPLGAQIVVTDVRTSEMIKYTANAFLATKISFINEIAGICQRVGADVKDVVLGAGSDKRIGTAFMNPGLGFGGSCFPKDVTALARIAEKNSVEPTILRAVLEVNKGQVLRCVARLEEAMGSFELKSVAVLGLSFKPNTDDVRESPAIRLVLELLRGGAAVRVHDPAALASARSVLFDRVSYHDNVYESLKDVDALIIATDWNEYKQIDLELVRRAMRGNILFDARNIYDCDTVTALGFRYYAVGRSPKGDAILAKVSIE